MPASAQYPPRLLLQNLDLARFSSAGRRTELRRSRQNDRPLCARCLSGRIPKFGRYDIHRQSLRPSLSEGSGAKHTATGRAHAVLQFGFDLACGLGFANSSLGVTITPAQISRTTSNERPCRYLSLFVPQTPVLLGGRVGRNVVEDFLTVRHRQPGYSTRFCGVRD